MSTYIVSRPLPAVCRPPSIVRCLLSTVWRLPSVAGRRMTSPVPRQSIIRRPSPVARFLPPAVRCPLSIVDYPLSTA